MYNLKSSTMSNRIQLQIISLVKTDFLVNHSGQSKQPISSTHTTKKCGLAMKKLLVLLRIFSMDDQGPTRYYRYLSKDYSKVVIFVTLCYYHFDKFLGILFLFCGCTIFLKSMRENCEGGGTSWKSKSSRTEQVLSQILSLRHTVKKRSEFSQSISKAKFVL